jgi:hypothetical protein
MDWFTGARWWLPDNFPWVGCQPACRYAAGADNTSHKAEWKIALAPGKSTSLTALMRAAPATASAHWAFLAEMCRGTIEDIGRQPCKPDILPTTNVLVSVR